MILLNPQSDCGKAKDVEGEFLYKTYDSKSNQEVFSEKMNLQQQETKDLVSDSEKTDRDKPMEYDKFLEILDQSANNITPKNPLPRLQTPISSAEKVTEEQTVKNAS